MVWNKLDYRIALQKIKCKNCTNTNQTLYVNLSLNVKIDMYLLHGGKGPEKSKHTISWHWSDDLLMQIWNYSKAISRALFNTDIFCWGRALRNSNTSPFASLTNKILRRGSTSKTIEQRKLHLISSIEICRLNCLIQLMWNHINLFPLSELQLNQSRVAELALAVFNMYWCIIVSIVFMSGRWLWISKFLSDYRPIRGMNVIKPTHICEYETIKIRNVNRVSKYPKNSKYSQSNSPKTSTY